MKNLVYLACVLVAAGCSDVASTAPTSQAAPGHPSASQAPSRDITCRNGYIVAYDQNGNPYCAPSGGPDGTLTTAMPDGTHG